MLGGTGKFTIRKAQSVCCLVISQCTFKKTEMFAVWPFRLGSTRIFATVKLVFRIPFLLCFDHYLELQLLTWDVLLTTFGLTLVHLNIGEHLFSRWMFPKQMLHFDINDVHLLHSDLWTAIRGSSVPKPARN